MAILEKWKKFNKDTYKMGSDAGYKAGVAVSQFSNKFNAYINIIGDICFIIMFLCMLFLPKEVFNNSIIKIITVIGLMHIGLMFGYATYNHFKEITKK